MIGAAGVLTWKAKMHPFPLLIAGAVVFEAAWLPVSYTHLRAHETVLDLVCRLLLEKKKNQRYVIRTLPIHINN